MRRAFLAAKLGLGATEKGLHLTSAFVVLVMMLLITTDVILRYLFNNPLPGTYEISEGLMVIIIFLALANTQARKGHLRVVMIVSRMPLKVRTAFELFALLFSLSVLSLIAWQGAIAALRAWRLEEISMGVIGYPLWIPKAALFLGCVALSVRFVVDFTGQVGVLAKSGKPRSE